jgi:DNA invertase Pin-like site-specific DNA recombinase
MSSPTGRASRMQPQRLHEQNPSRIQIQARQHHLCGAASKTARKRQARRPAGLAEFERTLIRARTGEGRERAKARGVRFGRPKKLSAHQRHEAIERIAAGEAVAEVSRTFGIDRATVYRLKP